MAIGFRSSTFASGSHTVANQNSFNLLYKGVDVYRSSGYYQNFSDAHNLMSYRHTRAHNTILVNGIGQPYSLKDTATSPVPWAATTFPIVSEMPPTLIAASATTRCG